MMDRIGGHLSYLSEYAGAAFQDSNKIQEVRIGANTFLLDSYSHSMVHIPTGYGYSVL